MYTKSNKISSNRYDLSNYIEGFDVYNSELINLIVNTDVEKDSYIINTYEYRPDLIAEDYYGSSSYLGLLFLMCGISFENYKKGTVLRLIKPGDLDNIISNI